MKRTYKSLPTILAAASVASFLSLASCERRTETERAVDKVGDKIEDAADEVGDAVEDATD